MEDLKRANANLHRVILACGDELLRLEAALCDAGRTEQGAAGRRDPGAVSEGGDEDLDRLIEELRAACAFEKASVKANEGCWVRECERCHAARVIEQLRR